MISTVKKEHQSVLGGKVTTTNFLPHKIRLTRSVAGLSWITKSTV